MAVKDYSERRLYDNVLAEKPGDHVSSIVSQEPTTTRTLPPMSWSMVEVVATSRTKSDTWYGVFCLCGYVEPSLTPYIDGRLCTYHK